MDEEAKNLIDKIGGELQSVIGKGKDWKKIIENHIKGWDKMTEEHKIFTLISVFAIGYMLGSLKR